MSPRKPVSSAAELIPEQPSLPLLKVAAADCRACDLWKKGTQTVFGDGRTRSKVMFVGEQPGNEEDLTGKPFVGPAGRLFDSALDEAGIERKQTYALMLSNISNGNRVASVAFIKSRMHRRSPPVVPGLKPK